MPLDRRPRDPGPPEPGALHFRVTGEGPNTPVLLLHGFTQTGRLWGPLADELAADRPVIAIDLPGHGGSSAVEVDLWRAADLVADVIALATGSDADADADTSATQPGGVEIGSPPDPGAIDVVGYSLGARLGLHLALAHPGRIRRLVLIGATAGIDEEAARAQRRSRDEELAASLLGTGDAAPLALEEFLDRWLANPLFAGLPPDSAGRGERLRNTPAGLASSLRLCGNGAQDPLWDRLREVTAPTLVIAGAADGRFSALGQHLVTGIGPVAELCLVPGATHAAHLHQPRSTALHIRSFLRDEAAAPKDSKTAGSAA